MDYPNELPWAHGRPGARALFKADPEDFEVDEILGFEPDGAGEHLFVQVEKRGISTPEAAQRLARHYGLPSRDVSWAGLKDRQGLTRQWFGLRVGLKRALPEPPVDAAALRVLAVQRNSRKLRTGSHRGNRFRIRLRDLHDGSDWQARLARIAARGVPNYFGPQRFGRGGDNVTQAAAFLAGERRIPDRFLRGMLISSARSWMFNRLLAWRVEADCWDRYLPGDFLLLDAGRGGFLPDGLDDLLLRRLQEQDVHPSGPLWGQGEARVVADAAALERRLAEHWPALSQGLERQGLSQERRALRLRVECLQHWRESPDGPPRREEDLACQSAPVVIEFALARGAYATAVLREVAELVSPAPSHP